MKVLVIGGGGREHALVWKIAQSPLVTKIYCAPGNPGIGMIAENVDINADDLPALLGFARNKGIDLTVTRADVFVIIGPNGCGKSTLLRCLNMLEPYQEGRVLLRGAVASEGRPDQHRPSAGERLQAQRLRQKVGMVFQQFNLFPHLTILENCMLAPRLALSLPRPKAEALAIASQ